MKQVIHEKLEEIKESIMLIQEWSKDVDSADDFMLSHEYANIDEVIVYDTIRNGLPELMRTVDELLKKY